MFLRRRYWGKYIFFRLLRCANAGRSCHIYEKNRSCMLTSRGHDKYMQITKHIFQDIYSYYINQHSLNKSFISFNGLILFLLMVWICSATRVIAWHQKKDCTYQKPNGAAWNTCIQRETSKLKLAKVSILCEHSQELSSIAIHRHMFTHFERFLTNSGFR